MSVIHQPVLVVNGESDRMVPSKNTVDLARRLPHANSDSIPTPATAAYSSITRSSLQRLWNSSSDEYQGAFPGNSGDPPYVQPQRGLSSLLTGVAFVPMMLLAPPNAAVGADRRTRRAHWPLPASRSSNPRSPQRMEHTMNQPSTITFERPTLQIASITFSNPPANLIVGETVTRLHETIVELGEDPDIQVVIFNSGHPTSIINHFDLAAAADFPAPEAEGDMPIWTDIVLRLTKAPYITHRVHPRSHPRRRQRAGPRLRPALREPREGDVRPARGRQRPRARRRWHRATAPVHRP